MRKITMDKLKKLTAFGVAMALVLTTSMPVATSTDKKGNGAIVVSAKSKKKDKVKPKFKTAGKTYISAVIGESIKIKKVTAKDNKDGNITKKIKVTVIKDGISYLNIAKKIKNNKSVSFSSTGKYKITYTVKDKAGNKATKTRYVTVSNPVVKTPTTQKTQTTQAPSTTQATAPSIGDKTEGVSTTQKPATTQAPSTTQSTPTTEKPSTTERPATTEAPVTTEKPATTEAPTTTEQPSQPTNQKVETFNYNGNSYTVRHTDVLDATIYYYCNKNEEKKPKIHIENELEEIVFDFNNGNSRMLKNSEYLKFLGKISATDYNGKNINCIEIFDYNLKNKIDNKTFTDNTAYEITIIAIDENNIGSYFTFKVKNEKITLNDDRDFVCYDPLVIGNKPQVPQLTKVYSMKLED